MLSRLGNLLSRTSEGWKKYGVTLGTRESESDWGLMKLDGTGRLVSAFVERRKNPLLGTWKDGMEWWALHRQSGAGCSPRHKLGRPTTTQKPGEPGSQTSQTFWSSRSVPAAPQLPIAIHAIRAIHAPQSPGQTPFHPLAPHDPRHHQTAGNVSQWTAAAPPSLYLKPLPTPIPCAMLSRVSKSQLRALLPVPLHRTDRTTTPHHHRHPTQHKH